jgi:hypothetical protein
MRYDRLVIAYHGCDATVAEEILSGQPFRRSENDYDWLGAGVYFWEYGPDRALQFARDKQRRGRIAEPAVVGALIQLGNCLDLMDTACTDELARAYQSYRSIRAIEGKMLPRNAGTTPDKKLRRLDCSVLNHYLDSLQERGIMFDTVRGGFTEGERAFPGSGIFQQSHIQIAVRSPACVLGVFRPRVPAWTRTASSATSASSSTTTTGNR